MLFYVHENSMSNPIGVLWIRWNICFKHRSLIISTFSALYEGLQVICSWLYFYLFDQESHPQFEWTTVLNQLA